MTPLDTFLACACAFLLMVWIIREVQLRERLHAVSARLAPFIAKRGRNKDGTFKSSKAT